MLALERDAAYSAHVLQQTVVLPEQRVLFLPNPKAGCTSVLWQLSALAGIPEEAFAASTLAEASSALTVHDLNVWGAGHRLGHLLAEGDAEVLGGGGWLRFTIVRDPWRRLWSAWQSKLLFREPRFVTEHGEAPWFPRRPRDPAELVEDFRRFAAAVAAGDAVDVHWSVQQELVAALPLDHVGRLERMDETMAVVRAHVGADRWPERPGRANESAVPYAAHAYDAATTALIREHYRPDFEAFGYDDEPPAPTEEPAAWERRVAPLLGLVRAAIGTHERVGQLHRLAQHRGTRVQELEARVERRPVRQEARSTAPTLGNDEGLDDYAVHWGWADGRPAPGFTAVVRVRDESRALPWVLPGLLRAAERVVLLDNGSTDGTADVAREVAAAAGATERLDVFDYPFAIARCGAEHLGTSGTSVHSLTYFYNWSFAHVRTGYALKWDGDMVLSDAAVAALRDLAWQLEATETVLRVPRLPLYVASDTTAYVDTELRNVEPWAWPNRPGYRFVKALEWELPMFPEGVATLALPDYACVELKFLDADEFAHWTPMDFDTAPRQARKRREQMVFDALASGGSPPSGVVRVDAPAGTHVIEHVRSVWLPAQAR